MQIVNSLPRLQNIPMPSRRIMIIGIASLSAAVLASLLFNAVSAQALSPVHHAKGTGIASGKVYLSAAGAAAADSAASAPAPMHEITIANNGLVLLRGALVTSISGDSIRMTVPFGGGVFTWLLKTNAGTKFITREGEEETLADIQVGDVITASGKLAGAGSTPVIQVQFVHE